MEKVRPWCGQPSDRGRLKIRSDQICRNSELCDPVGGTQMPDIHMRVTCLLVCYMAWLLGSVMQWQWIIVSFIQPTVWIDCTMYNIWGWFSCVAVGWWCGFLLCALLRCVLEWITPPPDNHITAFHLVQFLYFTDVTDKSIITYVTFLRDYMPSVLWRCWLGSRKGIWPVKKLSGGVLAWLSVCSEVQTFIWSIWCHCYSLSVASVKCRLILPFCYRLTWVVPDKGPLNVCSVVYEHKLIKISSFLRHVVVHQLMTRVDVMLFAAETGVQSSVTRASTISANCTSRHHNDRRRQERLQENSVTAASLCACHISDLFLCL